MTRKLRIPGPPSALATKSVNAPPKGPSNKRCNRHRSQYTGYTAVRIRSVSEGTIFKRRLATRVQDPVAAQDGVKGTLWDRICEGHREPIHWAAIDYQSPTKLERNEGEVEPNPQRNLTIQGQQYLEEEHGETLNGDERHSDSGQSYALDAYETKKSDVQAPNGRKNEGVVQRHKESLLTAVVNAFRLSFRSYRSTDFLHSTQQEHIQLWHSESKGFLKLKK